MIVFVLTQGIVSWCFQHYFETRYVQVFGERFDDLKTVYLKGLLMLFSGVIELTKPDEKPHESRE